ncbi:hypothetical protein BDW22DRAFT_1429154 [Trametopsis cervina]|nr:hypothetical protein BDW22DRAFT_1429154 [Trametopsis cervina]
MDDSPWGDDVQTLHDSEWSKISSDFTNAGYREGITAGKEAHLQQGFDDGFAKVGTPVGREIGLLRGFASAVLSYLKGPTCPVEPSTREDLLQEMRTVTTNLNQIRFSDIAPPDLEAEQHAREHLESAAEDRDDEMDQNEEVQYKRDVESLEDMMNSLGAGSKNPAETQRPTPEDVVKLSARLRAVADALRIPFPVGDQPT